MSVVGTDVGTHSLQVDLGNGHRAESEVEERESIARPRYELESRTSIGRSVSVHRRHGVAR